MDPLDDLLKNAQHFKNHPLPERFEETVLNNWFDETPEHNKGYSVWMFALAACLTAFTCINILSLNALKNSAAVSVEISASERSLEEDFVNAYGLNDNTSYYSLNE